MKKEYIKILVYSLTIFFQILASFYIHHLIFLILSSIIVMLFALAICDEVYTMISKKKKQEVKK